MPPIKEWSLISQKSRIDMIMIEKMHGYFDLKAVYTVLRAAKDGNYSITIKRVHKNRTNDQNGWLWGCVYPILLDALLDAGWEFTSTEQVHEFFKNQFTKDSAVNHDTGEIVEFPHSTAEMDTVTFSTYVEKLIDYAREYLNTEIPDPDINWHEKNP